MGGVPLIGDLFFPKTPNLPKVKKQEPSPTEIDPAVIKARQKELQRASLTSGSTVLTSGQGLTSPASTTKKSLLGV